jgi:hypothetical protein
MLLPSQEDLSTENVALILDIIRGSGYRTVHYTGRADENLLRGLLGEQPGLEVSVMDMPDRWKSGSRFFWDEREACGSEYPECPDWLEGILFYQEGASEHEIGIYDWPWFSCHQFQGMTAFTGRQPPRMVILFGNARLVKAGEAWMQVEDRVWGKREQYKPIRIRQSSYRWQTVCGLRIGRWKDGVISAYERRQLAKKRK